MKKTVILFLLLAFVLTGCGSMVTAPDASLADIRDEIAAELAPEDAVMLNAGYIYLAYGLEEADCGECAAFMISRGTFPEEYILVRAVSSEAAERIAQQLQWYLESILEQSRSYEPETYALLEDCAVLRQGNCVCLFLSGEHERAGEIFSAHLKEYETGTEPLFTNPPEATPVPEEESVEAVSGLAYGLVPASPRASDSAFDGVLFVGNSIAGNLEEYVTKQRMGDDPGCMGTAVFYTAPRFCYRTAVWGMSTGQPFPSIAGKRYEVEDAVTVAGADTVYLSMGFNDIANYPHDELSVTIDYVSQLIADIRAKNPDVTICILSLTPRIARHDHVGTYNNARIRELNGELLAWAEENECYFIDCFTPLAGEDGTLLPEAYREYGDTDGIHLNETGCRIWLDWLYTHTIP